MGWSIDITADQNIIEADVAAVLSELSGHDVYQFPERQSWGWSSLSVGAADVWLPKGAVLTVSGAWYSEGQGPGFAVQIAAALTGLGYTAQVGELRG